MRSKRELAPKVAVGLKMCRTCRKAEATYRCYCGPCWNAYIRAYRQRNLEKLRAYNAERNRRMRREKPAWWVEATRRHERGRRARKRGAGATVPINPDRIWERDGKRCHLCRKPILRHDLSMDHLVPLSSGGSHTPDNVAAAHVRCNVRRRHTGPAQLRLIG